MKKLIPAIALLLVSVVLLSTSSFAWFSMNTEVTATGMQVVAATSKNLLINTVTGTSGGTQSKTTTYSTRVTLTPSSATPDTMKLGKFYSANNQVAYDTGAAKVGTVFTERAAATSGDSGYAVKHTFYIYVDGTSADTMTNLYVSSISVLDPDHSNSAANENISKALRIGVVCGSSAFIYSLTGGDASYQGVKAASTVASIAEGVLQDSEDAAISAAVSASNSCSSSNVLAATVTSTAATQVDVYIWYEGQDAACTTANSVTTENLDITINFTATP